MFAKEAVRTIHDGSEKRISENGRLAAYRSARRLSLRSLNLIGNQNGVSLLPGERRIIGKRINPAVKHGKKTRPVMTFYQGRKRYNICVFSVAMYMAPSNYISRGRRRTSTIIHRVRHPRASYRKTISPRIYASSSSISVYIPLVRAEHTTHQAWERRDV